MGDSIGMFFCPSSARISAESSFIALVVLRPSVSQPASATTAASAAEVSKPRTYPENFNPMLPDPWSRTGPDRPVLRYPLSLKMRQSQGSPNPYPAFEHGYGERKVNAGQRRGHKVLPILRNFSRRWRRTASRSMTERADRALPMAVPVAAIAAA